MRTFGSAERFFFCEGNEQASRLDEAVVTLRIVVVLYKCRLILGHVRVIFCYFLDQ